MKLFALKVMTFCGAVWLAGPGFAFVTYLIYKLFAVANSLMQEQKSNEDKLRDFCESIVEKK